MCFLQFSLIFDIRLAKYAFTSDQMCITISGPNYILFYRGQYLKIITWLINKFTITSKSCLIYVTKDHELSANCSVLDKIKYAFFCPPHGTLGRVLTYTVLALSLWGSCLSMFGDIAAPPDGTIFWLIILVIVAMIFGWVFSLARLPPLLGMLLTGIRYSKRI